MHPDQRQKKPKVKVAVRSQVLPAPAIVLVGLLSIVVLLLGGIISGT